METKDFKEPFIPARKVDYASQSIVSREVLHNKGGNITLFAFDEGQALSEHTAPFDAVLQVIRWSSRYYGSRERVCRG